MSKKVVYKPYPLVFYVEDKELYDKLKMVSKRKYMNIRGYILLAIETMLEEEGIELNNIMVNGKEVAVSQNSSSPDDKWGNW